MKEKQVETAYFKPQTPLSKVFNKNLFMINETPKSPNSVAFSRTNSTKKLFKNVHKDKSEKELLLDKELKFNKNGNDPETNSLIAKELGCKIKIRRQNVDAQSQSRRFDTQLDEKVQQKYTNSRSSKPTRVSQTNQEYYIYWKKKAQQYLESNLKIINQITALKDQNQNLKQKMHKHICHQEIIIKEQKMPQKEHAYKQQPVSLSQIQVTNAFLKQKIQLMQKQLKRNVVIIASYEVEIRDLRFRLEGDTQRTKLTTKMKEQIQMLKQQIQFISKQLNKNTLNRHDTFQTGASGKKDSLITQFSDLIFQPI